MFGIVYGECPHLFATEPFLPCAFGRGGFLVQGVACCVLLCCYSLNGRWYNAKRLDFKIQPLVGKYMF